MLRRQFLESNILPYSNIICMEYTCKSHATWFAYRFNEAKISLGRRLRKVPMQIRLLQLLLLHPIHLSETFRSYPTPDTALKMYYLWYNVSYLRQLDAKLEYHFHRFIHTQAYIDIPYAASWFSCVSVCYILHWNFPLWYQILRYWHNGLTRKIQNSVHAVTE